MYVLGAGGAVMQSTNRCRMALNRAGMLQEVDTGKIALIWLIQKSFHQPICDESEPVVRPLIINHVPRNGSRASYTMFGRNNMVVAIASESARTDP